VGSRNELTKFVTLSPAKCPSGFLSPDGCQTSLLARLHYVQNDKTRAVHQQQRSEESSLVNAELPKTEYSDGLFARLRVTRQGRLFRRALRQVGILFQLHCISVVTAACTTATWVARRWGKGWLEAVSIV